MCSSDLDAKRSDASASTLIDGAISVSTYDGVSYYDAKGDTSGLDSMAVRVVYSRHTPGANAVSGSHRVKLKEVTYNVTLGGGADTDSLKIYEVDGATETEIWRSTPTSGSETSLWSLAYLYGETGITAKDGNELLVQIVDGTSITGSVHAIAELE